jgi:hypothetical protein
LLKWRRLDGFLESKFIIGVLSNGRFDNDQLLMAGINGGWHFNNFAQMNAK